MSGTYGLERYKDAMLATAAILYPPPPEPEARPIPVRRQNPRRTAPVRFGPPPGYIFVGPYVVPCARVLSISEVQTAVCEHYDLRPLAMTSTRRGRDEAWPRQVAMYLSKQLTPRSLPEIGRRFGGRDHTTVIHAVREVERRRASDPDLDRDIRSIRARLRGDG